MLAQQVSVSQVAAAGVADCQNTVGSNTDNGSLLQNRLHLHNVSACERERDEKCFRSENVIINHFNLVQSVIIKNP